MPLVVRDLSKESQKQVHLELQGEETRLDKNLVEQLLDPLVHLVRNAVAHGLETSQERRRARKGPTGTIELTARAEGNSVLIEIKDDGRGIQEAALRDRAPEVTSSETLLDLICRPGLSSRSEAEHDAGRGLGMEIVRQSVGRMGGTLSVESVAGQGTCFTMRLPVTLTILDALIVEASGQLFAVPLEAVDELVDLEESFLTGVKSGELLRHRDTYYPFLRLARVLQLDGEGGEKQALLMRGTGKTAYGITRVQGIREVVVRTVRDPLISRPWLFGVAEFGDGRLVLILHLHALSGRAA
jgi:two-component system chemotaxis sensor kinase CheA